MNKWLRTIIRRVIISAVREGQIKRFDASGLAGETFTDREMFQHYGFTSQPQDGAEAILIGIGNVLYLIAEDDRRYRIALAQGEVALYTDEGDVIHFKRGKEIDITSGGKVVVTAPDVEMGGGSLEALIDARIKTIYDAHTHNVVGVQAGSGTIVSATPTIPLDLSSCSTTKTKAS